MPEGDRKHPAMRPGQVHRRYHSGGSRERSTPASHACVNVNAPPEGTAVGRESGVGNDVLARSLGDLLDVIIGQRDGPRARLANFERVEGAAEARERFEEEEQRR